MITMGRGKPAAVGCRLASDQALCHAAGIQDAPGKVCPARRLQGCEAHQREPAGQLAAHIAIQLQAGLWAGKAQGSVELVSSAPADVFIP